ncbi:MAG: hypothetical protein RIA69_14915 [Cyclobacteriaceae bacterium]
MKIISIKESNHRSLSYLQSQLELLDQDALTLIARSAFDLQSDEKQLSHAFEKSSADVIFPASADFPFDVKGLNLYYWKYYPRERGTYHFLNADMVLGKASALAQLFKELIRAYGQPLVELSIQGKSTEVDAFHRFYIDLFLGLEKPAIKVSIDHQQEIFGTTIGRNSVVKWPIFTLRHGFIFNKYEKALLGKEHVAGVAWDYTLKNGKKYNKRTKQFPEIIIEPEQKIKGGLASFLKSGSAYIHSLYSIIKILIFNGGKRLDHEIFRFRHNQNPEIKANIDKLIANIENGQPFSFTHFNDGEMTFIEKFQEADHKEVWFGSYFGRIQDKYNKQLGELLLAAFLKRQDHYYIGIPCEISHPKLSQYARALRPVDEFTIPAMTFHHNLSKYPRILGAMRKKKVYFVVNINQDLGFFRQMGFEFDDDQIIRVPFRNAHEEYDNLKKHTFEDGAIVMLMSGMLAKILCAYWFEHHPKTTFIAFGSSFDDYIQSKISFNLYPKDFPFAKTLIGSRSYLFGHKSHCPNCYDMTKPNPGV